MAICHRHQAISRVRSRHSRWHMAKTIASGVGLTNAWLTEQGLLSLKNLWSQLSPQFPISQCRTAQCGPARYVMRGGPSVIGVPTRFRRLCFCFSKRSIANQGQRVFFKTRSGVKTFEHLFDII